MANCKNVIDLITDIRRSYFQMIVYWLGLYPDDMKKVVLQRKSACQDCPLNDNGWCSKKKAVNVITYPHREVFRNSPTKMIYGCGCWLAAKVFSIISPCPLNRWDSFSCSINKTK